MVDLKAKPFYLNDEDIQWVNDTLDSLSLDEKIGQLFMDMIYVAKSEEDIKSDIEKYGMSGFRYGNRSASEIYDQNAIIQKYSKIPALIAANIEAGGNNCASDGTLWEMLFLLELQGTSSTPTTWGITGAKKPQPWDVLGLLPQ